MGPQIPRSSVTSVLKLQPAAPGSVTLYLIVCAVLVLASINTAARAASGQEADSTITGYRAQYEAALRYRASGEPIEAVITLKNALQEKPDHVPSLILMGEIYLDQRLGDAAETTFRRARMLGADQGQSMLLLGYALLAQRKAEQALTELSTDGLAPAAQAQVYALRAEANLILSRVDAANRELNAADAAMPQTLEADLVRVALLLRRGRTPRAEQLAARLLQQWPQRSEVWNVAGSASHAAGKLEEALHRYGRAIDINPGNGDARIARLSILIDTRRDDEASADLAYFAENHPSEPRASYLRAVKLARAGDTFGATQALSQTTYVLSTHHKNLLYNRNSPLLLIAALSHYGLDQQEQAIAYAEAYLAMHHDHVGVRRLLGDAMLRANRAQEAVRVLETALTYAPTDIALLTLTANAYGQLSRFADATRLLEKVLRTQTGGPFVQTHHAAMQIGAGAVEEGIAALSRLVDKDPVHSPAGLALMLTHQQNDNHSQAISVGEQLAARDPENLSVINLLGVSYFLADKLDEAQAQFASCLARDPGFLPAAINAAKVDLARGNTRAARERLTDLASKNRSSGRLQLELSRVAIAEQQPRAAIDHARKAQSLAPGNPDVLRNLVDLHLQADDISAAGEVARSAATTDPTNLEIRELELRTLLAEQRHEAARPLLLRMADLAGGNVEWLMKIAAYQANLGFSRDAVFNLQTVVSDDPNKLTAQAGLIEQLLAQNKTQQALQAVTAALQRFPRSAHMHLLHGEILLATGDNATALEYFDRALQFLPLNLAVIRGAHALAAEGDLEAAEQRLQNWLQQNDDDQRVQKSLAELYLTTGQYALAAQAYRRLVAARSEDVALINNLAFALHKVGDREGRKMAERAYTLAPNDAKVNDTLGWILVNEGEADEALGYLRDASARDFRDSEIRYHLAVCLHNLGRHAEARSELTAALSSTLPFNDRDNAQSLLQTLNAAL